MQMNATTPCVRRGCAVPWPKDEMNAMEEETSTILVGERDRKVTEYPFSSFQGTIDSRQRAQETYCIGEDIWAQTLRSWAHLRAEKE